ncbi:E3 SUMO-protein ligase ZBED1-like isoform X2 [Chanodichthys erythropterus]
MLDLPHHKLIKDVAVRWNSAYEMLSRFLEQQPAICASLLSPEVRKSVSDICTLNEMEISNAEDVVKALKPMLVATNVMCEERTPTVSIIAPLHTQLLSDMSSTAKDSPLIKELKNAIYEDLSKRYNSSKEKSNLYISSALDPRFKSLLFLSPEDMHETFTKVVSKAAALNESADLMDNRFQSTPPPDQEGSTMYAAADGMIDYSDPGKDLSTAHCPKRRKSALADLLGQTFNNSCSTSTSMPSAATIAEQEMKRYQEAPALPLTDDPLQWWK